MRVACLYFMTDQPERVRATAPQHAGYWEGLAVPGYPGGPFSDRRRRGQPAARPPAGRLPGSVGLFADIDSEISLRLS
jgi:hypothetical protein